MPVGMIDDPIQMEKKGFPALGQFLSGKSRVKTFVLTDANVHRDCFPELISSVPGLSDSPVFIMPAGEGSKTMESVQKLCEFLSIHHAGRDALLVNLGGGVVTDLGGFSASIYKRGISFINIPTSLMAQIDASIGGKTGVDAFGIKNILGTFSRAESIFIYPGFLKTLDKRELFCGFAEALKHGLIMDKEYWKELQHFDFADFDPLIFRSLEIKSSIVKSDPFETGDRKKLNFGHTVGHSIESYFINRGLSTVNHGEAVAAGMICESLISVRLTGLPQSDFDEIGSSIRRFYSDITLPASREELLSYMFNDKKNVGGEVKMTLLTGIGSSVVDVSVSRELIIESLDFYTREP